MVRIVTALLLLGLLSLPAHAQKRVALVVGNSAYQHTARLDNPRNDATDMADVLKRLGFEVVDGFDLDKVAFERKVRDFSVALRTAEVGLFFYAGHGLQVGGQNYLVPVDAKAETADALDWEMVRLDLVQRTMERATATNIVFLDACRNNPLARNLSRAMGTRSADIGRGLAPVQSGVGTLISFSTQPGNVALDGKGRNSPFAGALVKRIATSNDDLSGLLIDVRNDVIKETQNAQVPWEHSALRGRFYFNPARAQSATAAALAPPIDHPDDKIQISDPGLFKEIRERLYELNFDPGPLDGPNTDAARQAIREFEQQNNLTSTGTATQGLLRRLRELGSLKPWGAIVYAKDTKRWGMSWDEDTRKGAIASARASCGDAIRCPVEVSFFGTECGVFAHSESNWAITARQDIRKAKEAALSDCKKRGKDCRIVAAVCADGTERFSGAN